jgi:nicotinate dehydrogenase subunit A
MTDKTITFTVNGAPVESRVGGDTPLMYVLRNDLHVKGARAGCGVGSCGSCMVWMDGRAINSCDTPLWSVEGRQVTTVEGLGTPQAPHPVQRAFIELQAAQCGYCINGIMMSVAALSRQPEPATEEALQTALTRHLCRCGTHLRIVQAARRALGIEQG